MDSNQRWDDLIVGAGSSGAVLASRLSEHPGRNVLLLEAGPDFPNPDQMPEELKDASSAVISGYNWDYHANLRMSNLSQNLAQSIGVMTSAPRAMLSAASAAIRSSQPISSTLQQQPYFFGKLVGGSSAINGAVALRGMPEDFDHWSALGNTEWAWENVLPYYKKIETDRDFKTAAHGTEGPVPITRPRLQDVHELQRAFFEACKMQGLAEIEDFNASSSAGVGVAPTNAVKHKRISTALSYLFPARGRKDLTIKAGTMVNRLLFDGRRVIGVEVTENGKKKEVLAQRTTLSAGTVNTAAILIRSGVGNATTCRSLGVDPVVELPGVGENLCDHPAVMMWMVPKAGICREGEPYHEVMARVSSNGNQIPDLQIFMLSNMVTTKVPMLSDLLRAPLASAISVMVSHPESRGRVRLENASPESNPVIELNLVSSPHDIDKLMHGIRLAWKIARSSPLADRTESIFLWNDAIINSDKSLKNAINRFINGAWHPVGTAKMGPAADPMAVVDQHCRVHHLDNLRIVDASVMPCIPSGPTSLSCIMLGERAAAWMAEEQEACTVGA